jgi:hypothetical protein
VSFYPAEQGVFYFQESKDDASSGGGGTLEATWAVLRGSAALAAVLPAKLKVPLCTWHSLKDMVC